MLWSNLTKLNSVCLACLKLPLVGARSMLEEDSIRKKLECSSTPMVDLAVELFARGESRKFNRHANYDFLGSVWANFSSVIISQLLWLYQFGHWIAFVCAQFPVGRQYLLGMSPYLKPPSEAPLAQISPFTEHPSIIRRGGSISTIK